MEDEEEEKAEMRGKQMSPPMMEGEKERWEGLRKEASSGIRKPGIPGISAGAPACVSGGDGG